MVEENFKTMFDVYYMLDVIICCFLHTPFTVLYWRGTWHLQDVYIFPHNAEFNCWTSLVVGIVINSIFYFTQGFHLIYFTNLSKIPYYIVSRLYTYVFAFGIVSHWRGVWLVLDFYTEITWTNEAICTCTGVIGLMLLRSYCNVLAAPVVIAMDCFKKSHFSNSTRFRCKKKTFYFIIDTLFTVVIIHSLVVLVWRGFWEMLDLGLYTEDIVNSALLSLLIGYILLMVVLCIQNHVAALSGYLQNRYFLLKIIVEDVHIFLLSLIAVSSWRGLWYLLDLYLFPQNLELSYWASHLTGFVGLAILGAFNSVLVRGCSLDGDVPGGKGVLCDIGYLSRSYVDEDLTETEEMESLTSSREKYLHKEGEFPRDVMYYK